MDMRTLTMRIDTSDLATPPVCSDCNRRIVVGETYTTVFLPIGSLDIYGRVATSRISRFTNRHTSCPCRLTRSTEVQGSMGRLIRLDCSCGYWQQVRSTTYESDFFNAPAHKAHAQEVRS